MTTAEFSNQFDVLYNNIMSNQAPGLDEYEKSVFLTKAEIEITLAFYNPKGNKYFEGFDGNERRQIDFSMLMGVHQDTSPGSAIYEQRTSGVNSVTIPEDVLLFTNESVVVNRGGEQVVLSVIPINYVEYARLMAKPFKRPAHYQAWRLINGADSGRKSDIIAGPSDTITKYVARYVRRPKPIILINLSPEGLSIDGRNEVTECELDPIIHQDILQRAVELAKAAYTGDLGSQLALGTNSETEKGMLTQSNR